MDAVDGQIGINPAFVAFVQTEHYGEIGLGLADGGKQLIVLKRAGHNDSYRAGGLPGTLCTLISAEELRLEAPVYCDAVAEIGHGAKIRVSRGEKKSLSDLAEELYSEGTWAWLKQEVVPDKYRKVLRNLVLEALPLVGGVIAFYNAQKRLSERLRQQGWSSRAEPVRLYLLGYLLEHAVWDS